MNILVFGDSITQGFHDDQSGGWCNRLFTYANQKILETNYEYDVTLFNLGISGDNTQDLKQRLPHELAARCKSGEEAVVIIAIGINDSQYELATNENRVPIKDFEANVYGCIEEVQKYTDKIFFLNLLPIVESMLMPMPWKPTHGYNNMHSERYNKIIKTTATETGATLIDVAGALGNDPAIYLPDGIHPNAVGHQLIFERVKSALEKEGIL